MAFYRRQFVGNCQYRSVDADCEHVLFHDCLTQNYGGRMMMNTAQVVRYSFYAEFSLKKLTCAMAESF
jgi:hypothetical protein